MNPERYVWDSERLLDWGISLANFIRPYPEIHLLTEIPGNIGDHLIWGGTEDFLKQHQILYKKISYKELNHFENLNGSLLIPGSGALTVHFHEWMPGVIENASNIFANVIVLPSQIEVAVLEVRETLKLSNVVFFARDKNSYLGAKELAPIGLAVDLALFSNYFDTLPGEGQKSIKDVLVCLRTDAASKFSSANYSSTIAHNNDISSTCPNLQSWIRTIGESELIITDRLHVAVSAVMMNKNLYYSDPHNNKISDYFKFTFGSATPSKNVQQVDELWLDRYNDSKLRDLI